MLVLFCVAHSYLTKLRDNGSGIGDLASCAIRYTTSKLNDFDGLNDVHTYGFRGEGLNSICALGEVSIITRTTDALVGSKASFGPDGACGGYFC